MDGTGAVAERRERTGNSYGGFSGIVRQLPAATQRT